MSPWVSLHESAVAYIAPFGLTMTKPWVWPAAGTVMYGIRDGHALTASSSACSLPCSPVTQVCARGGRMRMSNDCSIAQGRAQGIVAVDT